MKGDLVKVDKLDVMDVASALEIPDISSVDLDELDTDSLVEFAASMDAQLFRANALVQEALLPMRTLSKQAKDKLLASFPEGAKELPHDTFIVRKEQRTEREKRVSDFRLIFDTTSIPSSDFEAMCYVKAINGHIPKELVVMAEDEGCKVEWEVDLRKADAIGRKYGGEIQEAIAKASPRVETGLPYLTIEPREKVLKEIGTRS